MSEPEQFLLRWRGQTTGPFAWPAILQMLDEHEIGLWHEIQHQGRWLPLGEFLQARSGAAAAPARKGPIKVQPLPEPAPAPPESAPPVTVETQPEPAAAAPRFRPKSLKAFIGLGVFLGFVGAHNFYAGYRATAVAQLLLTGLTCWLGFGFFVTWLWAFIELLVVHTDGRGVRMT
jgi:hypothetical protein